MIKIVKKLKGWKPSLMVMAVVAIPLKKQESWTQVNYSSIPANQVSFSKQGMAVKIKSSASPLVYKLKSTQTIKKIFVSGELKGQLNLKKGIEQGVDVNDDFVFRIGLVVPGKQTLNFFQRMAAASWVKTLFKLAPKGQGLKEILFLNAVQDRTLIGKERSHPKSKLLKERYVWFIKKEGRFELVYELPQPIKASALWLSLDGDESKSNFEVTFDKMNLEEE